MALTGWSGTNFLRREGAVLTAAPLTMACWMYANSAFTGTQDILGIFNSAAAAIRDQWALQISSTGVVQARAADSVGNSTANSTATASVGSWFHACAVFAAVDSRAAYLNGANKGTATGSRSPSGLNRTSSGLQDNTAANNNLLSNTRVAELGIWNTALSDSEVAQLAVIGTPATAVRLDALLAYWRLLTSSDTNDIIGANSFVIQGSLNTSDHPWNIGARMGTIGCGL